MPTPVEQFNYDLPKEFIAQTPVEPRDHAKMMRLDRGTGAIEHKHFFDLPTFLKPGDVLVFNNTKVFKARLHAKIGDYDVEVFLLRGEDISETDPSLIRTNKTKGNASSKWQILAKPGKWLPVGETFSVGEGFDGTVGEVIDKHPNGVGVAVFPRSVAEMIELANTIGEVPLPPYIKTPANIEEYQTAYAEHTGSVAAPTAGFHFNHDLLARLREHGVQMEYVTLHVGMGTFQPMKSQTIEEHQMHAEFASIDSETATRLAQAKAEGRRIIAVGTTSVRTLESLEMLGEFAGDVNIFITPGYVFKYIDGMITNFHLPKSTLLVLVSTFAGYEHIVHAYEEAKKNNYRFYSFGDGMLIL